MYINISKYCILFFITLILATGASVKLDLQYSIGMAACVLPNDGKILWGLATSTGVCIYSYDPATNKASEDPIVSTQGDPCIVETFKE